MYEEESCLRSTEVQDSLLVHKELCITESKYFSKTSENRRILQQANHLQFSTKLPANVLVDNIASVCKDPHGACGYVAHLSLSAKEF